jgi:hypothetical protein
VSGVIVAGIAARPPLPGRFNEVRVGIDPADQIVKATSATAPIPASSTKRLIGS